MAASLAVEAGLDETERGTLAVVATELATNLSRYAKNGALMMRLLGTRGSGGVELLAIDQGPGISDLGRALTDGFSSGGTSGHGLGAIQRMSGEFDITTSGTGTVVLARVWSADGARTRAQQAVAEGVVCTPIQGERACGDAWMIQHEAHRSRIVLADGLGHGIEAARAADTAMRIASENAACSPAEVIQLAHAAMRATRGAALVVADLRRDAREVHFVGIGNIAGSIISPVGSKSMASHNGTVGHTMSRLHEFTYEWPADATIVLHSDGLMTRWRLDNYPGLVARHPALIAGVLQRDFTRGRDDATVVAVRERAWQPLS